MNKNRINRIFPGGSACLKLSLAGLCLLFFLLVFPRLVSGQGEYIKTYHDESHEYLKEIYRVRDLKSRILEGDYKAYYLNGQLKTQGEYVNNVPDGVWTYYYENGNIKMRGRLKGNESYGYWRYYHDNGQPSMEGEMKSGIRDGFWKFFYESGIIKNEGHFSDGKKSGTWTFYYEDGSLKAQADYIGNLGRYTEYFSSGTVKMKGYHLDGKSDSLWTYYNEEGMVEAEGSYKKGFKNGKWTYFFEDGTLSAEGYYEDGEKNGKWTYYFGNGNVSSEGTEKDGKREGYWKLYNFSGNFIGDGHFAGGSGKYHEYYLSGKVKLTGQILEGKYDGQWRYFYEDGTLEGECFFTEGEGEYTGYYPSGRIKMKGKIRDGKNIGQWELYDENGTLTGYYKPLYENDQPDFKPLKEEPAPIENNRGGKPEYVFRKKNNRYFTPVVNEFSGLILATNPVGVVIGRLPLSIEYYNQERLGHEITIQIARDPFFANDQSIQANTLYNRGFDVAIRQKLYQPEKSLGIVYFANELRYTKITHSVNTLDSLSTPEIQSLTLNAEESKFEYSFLIGDRWIKLSGDRRSRDKKQNGITVDIYAGLGIGYRLFEKKFDEDPVYDQLFSDLKQEKLSLSPRFGVNLGYVF